MNLQKELQQLRNLIAFKSTPRSSNKGIISRHPESDTALIEGNNSSDVNLVAPKESNSNPTRSKIPLSKPSKVIIWMV